MEVQKLFPGTGPGPTPEPDQEAPRTAVKKECWWQAWAEVRKPAGAGVLGPAAFVHSRLQVRWALRLLQAEPHPGGAGGLPRQHRALTSASRAGRAAAFLLASLWFFSV